MRRIILSCFCFFVLLAFANAQVVKSGHQVDFEINAYENDTLIVAYYYGDRHLVQDTLLAVKPGKFVLKGDEPLNPGVYLMMTKPEGKYSQFLVNENEQFFKIKCKAGELSKLKIKGSNDNKLFYDYMEFLAEMRPRAEFLSNEIKELDSSDPEHILKSRALEKLDKQVLEKQEKIVEENPNTITAMLIKGNKSIDIPDFEGSDDEIQQNKFLYFRDHFFDFVDLGNPAIIRTPFLHQKIERYVEKLTYQHPDSIIHSIDYLLSKLEGGDGYKFYLSYFLNDAAKSKVVGHDAIYVHLMDNYYSKGKAPWADDENLKKLKKNADRMRPVLIGKTVDDLELFREDGSPFKLSDVSTSYTVIMFWAPDCGHCKKAMPDAIAFNEKFKDKDVSFLAVCTKTRDKYATCWEAIEEKNMQGFLNLGDEFHKSRFKSKLNVRTTPLIFILDKNREILIKGIGAAQLEEVMNQIFAGADL